ncbi:MAG: DUF1287 domain-containing protein [Proteobacteria bacterium]|nr:DUF1287 domain-containing protein [Pseudomonadota bacterium]
MNKFIYIVLTFVSNALFAETNLVAAAKERLKHFVIYDGSYQKIPYPNGDVHKNKGVCTDVIIRSYRSLGVDLQKLVHEDMQQHFDKYPKIWGLTKPDTNIDHRRVPNLETFFQRHGKILPISSNPTDYQPGDIVTWRLDNNLPHIGIVSDIPSKADNKRYKIIHNIGLGPQHNDILFDYKIVGHFRY